MHFDPAGFRLISLMFVFVHTVRLSHPIISTNFLVDITFPVVPWS